MKVGFKHIRSVMLLLTGCFGILSAGAHVKRAEVYNACVPVVLDRTHNVVAEFCIEHDGVSPARLDGIEVRLGGLSSGEVRSVRLLCTGTMSALLSRSTSYAMRDEFRRLGGGQRLYADPGYAIEQDVVTPVTGDRLSLTSGRQLVKGRNYFYVSVESDIERLGDLSRPFTLEVTGIRVNGASVAFASSGSTTHRWGVSVRQHGDDGIYAYRIPGLVTTPSGTLLGVYDVRHRTSLDLQEHIDIGLSRSTDGGRTWEPMRIIMDMGEWGGLPESQNGIGDPSILVDDRTGAVFVVAAWTHGLGNNRAWTSVGQGYDPIETAQLMLASSRDDGRSWSAPRNLTRQIKQPHWYFTLQGPGRGITMRDGTLVFPIQYIDSTRVPNAGVMYSRDHGKTWHTHGHARSNTTESQVAEVAPGVLMLNMRDNRRTGRAVCTTRDMGRTWVEHPSSGCLREPVCMASLLHVPAWENALGRDLLLFSNPDTTKGRNHLTIKASLDGGDTWLAEHALLLDEEENWGYSCLSMIDPETVGILYESSAAQLLFQAVKLRDIIRELPESGAVFEPLPEIGPCDAGFAQGVSALCAGEVSGTLIAAGGANFAETPAAEGGAKCFYDGIWTLRGLREGKPVWRSAGHLPEPMAYGMTWQLPDELIVAGGANASGPLRRVLSLRPRGGKVVVRSLPDLPFAVEQGAAASDGGVLYLVGGLVDGKPSCEVLACDMGSGARTWQSLPPLPEPFVQPVAFASAGRLYVWGGFDPAERRVADHGYCCDPATGRWERIAGLPDGGTMTGSAGVKLADGRLLVAGGVDRAIFSAALGLPADQMRDYLSQPPAATRFRNVLWLFDPTTGAWSQAGISGRAARAGAALVAMSEGAVMLGGETRPGIRTPRVWRIDL